MLPIAQTPSACASDAEPWDPEENGNMGASEWMGNATSSIMAAGMGNATSSIMAAGLAMQPAASWLRAWRVLSPPHYVLNQPDILTLCDCVLGRLAVPVLGPERAPRTAERERERAHK